MLDRKAGAERTDASIKSSTALDTKTRAMSIATTHFLMWGVVTSLNDILIPRLCALFDLDYTRSMLVQVAFLSSYFVFALPTGELVKRVG